MITEWFCFLDSIFDENKIVSKCHTIIPPVPIRQYIYLCDRRFHTEGLHELYHQYPNYGLVIVSGEGCKCYIINQINYKRLYHKNVQLAKRHKKGGQSQNRFQRSRDENISNYISIISDTITINLTENGVSTIKRLFIAGHSDKKDLLAKSLSTIFPIEVLTVDDTTTGFSIYQHYQQLKQSGKLDEKNDEAQIVIDEFCTLMETNVNKIVYSKEECSKHFKQGLIEKLVIHNSIKFNQPKKTFGTKFYRTDSSFVKQFGGAIGILYYSKNDDFCLFQTN